MHELICPHCKKAFTVDEADYANILTQVRTSEFQAEVERRIEEAHRLQKSEEARKAAEVTAAHEKALAERDGEITRLQQQLQGMEEKKGLEIAQALSEREAEITRLRQQLAGADETKKLEIQNRLLEEQQRSSKALASKESELQEQKEKLLKVQNAAAQEKLNAESRERTLVEQHRLELEAKDKEVAFYRDFKAKRSVKLLGEDLEQHCYMLYNQTLLPVMPYATFEKDNDAVREDGETKGSKGDFIFRDREDGVEYLSIMFEMKNEGDESATKHRNADFFAKLDSDRKKKGCEFAVLVSMLEMDNDMYNNGIVVVPGYEKMYVVRPDNFISIITLLVQTSKNAASYKKELVLARSQSVDVTHFEEILNNYKDGFGKAMVHAKKKYDEAIEGINRTITSLENIKKALQVSIGHLDAAENKLDDLTIRKLTYKNPTMKAAFAEARAKKAEEGPDEQ